MLEADRIYNVSCVGVGGGMSALDEGSVDLVIADPPYYTTQWIKKQYWGKEVAHLAGVKGISRFEADWDKFKSEAEYQEFTDKWIKEAYRVLKPKGTIFVHTILSGEWTGLPNVVKALKENGFKKLNLINWCKPNGQPNLAGVRFAFCTEQIIWAGKEGERGGKRTFNYQELKRHNRGVQLRDYWLIPTEPTVYGHPSVKPLALVERMIRACSNEDDLVVDPFIGSGTTAVGCKRLKRHYIGFEINLDYCRIAEERLRSIPARLDLFNVPVSTAKTIYTTEEKENTEGE